MKLKHPLNPDNEANKKAIEKYADRIVVIEHGLNTLWMGHNGWVPNRNEAEEMTFKNALKKTKHYKASSMIVYHFLSQNDDVTPMPISEYDSENFLECTAVKFDDASAKKYRTP